MNDNELHTDLAYWIQHDRVRAALIDLDPTTFVPDAELPPNLVCFDTDDRLVWGEEFLEAIIRTGSNVQTMIVRNLRLADPLHGAEVMGL